MESLPSGVIDMAVQAPDEATASRRKRGRAGYVVLATGAVILLGAAALSIPLFRGPALTPVPYGSHVVVTQQGIDGVTVFTSGGPAAPPQCFVNGDPNPLDQGPSADVTAHGLIATYSFGVTFPAVEGTTYTVTCGTPAQPGQFAAIQYEPALMRVAVTAIGILGLVIVAAGLLTLLITGRRRNVDHNPNNSTQR